MSFWLCQLLKTLFLLSFERLVRVSLVDAFGLPLLGAAFKATSFGGGGLLPFLKFDHIRTHPVHFWT